MRAFFILAGVAAAALIAGCNARTASDGGPMTSRTVEVSDFRKLALAGSYDVDLKTGLVLEVEAYNRTVVTEDRLEGVKAFAEKRKPKFTGK